MPLHFPFMRQPAHRGFALIERLIGILWPVCGLAGRTAEVTAWESNPIRPDLAHAARGGDFRGDPAAHLDDLDRPDPEPDEGE